MIKSKQITSLNIVKYILDSLKPMNKHIDKFDENSYEYETLCEKIQDQLLKIEESLIGMEKCNKETQYKSLSRMMSYWSYLKEEIDFEELIKRIETHADKLLLK